MARVRYLGLIVLLVALLIVSGAAYTVPETEQVIITQFGKPVGDAIDVPGLHFKVPFLQKVHRFEKRFLEWDAQPTELTTEDKRFIHVDTYARWQISDPLLFFQRLRNESGAQSRLDDVLEGETRNAIAKHNLVEVVRSSNREPDIDEDQLGAPATLEQIEYGRERIRQEILTNSQARTGDLGIEILDVQIKRINYVEEVRLRVYDRMIAERRRIAARFRSEGEGDAASIRGDLERDLKKIQSEAYRKAQEIVGKADAEATEIYAKAYNQSADSRRFYEFLKSMETLSSTTDESTSVLLSTEGEFYRYLNKSGR
ncbi:MAG: protease modulator HflC [Acidobacteriota bacterium]|nr:protease modulator HflC [Acidobacteriota bacterium]